MIGQGGGGSGYKMKQPGEFQKVNNTSKYINPTPTPPPPSIRKLFHYRYTLTWYFILKTPGVELYNIPDPLSLQDNFKERL